MYRRGCIMGAVMKSLLSSAIIALALGSPYSARAQSEVTLIAPGGIRAAVEQLIPAFERKTGHKVKATFGSGLGTKQQVARGEAFDVPVVQPPYPEVLASGYVVNNSAKPLASVAVGIAVRQGAPRRFLVVSDDAGAATPRVLQELSAAGIEVISSSEYRPSFDEVFTALVSQSDESYADQGDDAEGEGGARNRRAVSRAA